MFCYLNRNQNNLLSMSCTIPYHKYVLPFNENVKVYTHDISSKVLKTFNLRV